MHGTNSSLSGSKSYLPMGQGNTRNISVCPEKPHELGLDTFSSRTNKIKAGGSPSPACVFLLVADLQQPAQVCGVIWEEN